MQYFNIFQEVLQYFIFNTIFIVILEKAAIRKYCNNIAVLYYWIFPWDRVSFRISLTFKFHPKFVRYILEAILNWSWWYIFPFSFQEKILIFLYHLMFSADHFLICVAVAVVFHSRFTWWPLERTYVVLVLNIVWACLYSKY